MRFKMKTSSDARLACPRDRPTRAIRSAIVTKWRVGIAACILVSGAINASLAAVPKPVERLTGICFRRISALDKRGIVINRYESILMKSSGSLYKDLARLEIVAHDTLPLRSPDLKPFYWISAVIGDNTFSETTKLSCSKLPSLEH